jgi:hypothetical protein
MNKWDDLLFGPLPETGLLLLGKNRHRCVHVSLHGGSTWNSSSHQ